MIFFFSTQSALLSHLLKLVQPHLYIETRNNYGLEHYILCTQPYSIQLRLYNKQTKFINFPEFITKMINQRKVIRVALGAQYQNIS